MIRTVARQKHVQQYIIEKDYALSYLLAAIAQTEGMGENLALKGGTALKKLYFADYRFSEDLDYSTRVLGPIAHIDQLMELVVHSMNEMLYSLTEITAEKLRALLQSKARLHERGWGASRVCRDYYDLWRLLQVQGVRSPDLVPLLAHKCMVRRVSYQSGYDFLADNLFAVARSEWSQQLQPFVPDAPPAAELLPELQSLILSIWE